MFRNLVVKILLTSLLTGGFAQALGGPRSRGAAVRLEATLIEDDALQARVNASMRLTAGTLLSLNIDAPPETVLRIKLPLDGELRELYLSPHSVRSDSYLLLVQDADGVQRSQEPGPIRTLRGIVGGSMSSKVAGSWLQEGLVARIRLAAENEYWIEPVDAELEGAAPGLHVLYRPEDVLESGSVCGVSDDAGFVESADLEPPQGAVLLGGGDLCVTEISFDADTEYFSALGSVASVQTRINGIVNTMNLQYESEVGITHTIKTILVRTTTDPYNSSNMGTTLSQFRSEWNGPQLANRGDVNELFSGKNFGSTIGLAYVGTVCTSSRYNMVVNVGPASCRSDLSAHELGHSWSAGHCSCPNKTMNPVIACVNTFHATSTVPGIISFRNSRGCIVCVPPVSPPTLAAVKVDATGTNLATADIQALVDTPDWWTLGGLTNESAGLAPLAAGVSLLRQIDPNTGNPVLTRVFGGGNPGNPVTFVSLPRAQFANQRFGSNGEADIVGAFDPTGATAVLTASQVNLGFAQIPPSVDGTDLPDDGFFARVTLDLNGSAFAGQEVVVSQTGVPAGFPVVLGEFKVASATKEFSDPLVELTFGFYTTEPSGCFGDLDGDNEVGLSDLAILLSNFGLASGATPADGDLDGNGTVDLADLALLLSAFGTTCP